jgi:phosphoribosylglycinamide formyltransferase 1
MKKIVIFASGNGSNAENIILHFKQNKVGTVVAVFTNNPRAKVIEKSKNQEVACEIFQKNDLDSITFENKLMSYQPDLVILAGFLLKFPENLINKLPNRVINIHPALLPKYGGKGMYGHFVHEAVLQNQEKETGITIHYVNKHYDEGKFIFQKSVGIENCKSVDEITKKIHELEMEHFPKVIEGLLG